MCSAHGLNARTLWLDPQDPRGPERAISLMKLLGRRLDFWDLEALQVLDSRTPHSPLRQTLLGIVWAFPQSPSIHSHRGLYLLVAEHSHPFARHLYVGASNYSFRRLPYANPEKRFACNSAWIIPTTQRGVAGIWGLDFIYPFNCFVIYEFSVFWGGWCLNQAGEADVWHIVRHLLVGASHHLTTEGIRADEEAFCFCTSQIFRVDKPLMVQVIGLIQPDARLFALLDLTVSWVECEERTLTEASRITARSVHSI